MRISAAPSYAFWKRCLDIAGASIALVLMAPLLLVAAVAVRLTLGDPVIFRQIRPGLHGNPFQLYKLRTMRDAHGLGGALLPDAERLTRLGRFLRSTSLDELPELLNVLHGNMSLVGPRPLLMEYLELYSPQQARRHDVRPGITGWAQVNGRNALSWDEKFTLDIYYVEHQSFLLDMKILFLTMKRVMARDGISHGAEATMPRFNGSTEMHV